MRNYFLIKNDDRAVLNELTGLSIAQLNQRIEIIKGKTRNKKIYSGFSYLGTW